MRIVSWTIPAYGLAVCLVLAVLLSGHSGAAHASALAPFAVLVSAVAAARRRPGRALAILGLIATAAVVIAFTSSAGDWYADGALAVGVFLLTAALLRSGGSRELRRRRPLGIVLGSLAGLVMLLSAAALVASLPEALHPPVGCVDTCWGAGLGAFFAALMVAETILLVLTFVALFVSPMTGLGAFIMAAGLNMCFFLAPPAATATYAIAVATWYLGLFILAQSWTRMQPTVCRASTLMMPLGQDLPVPPDRRPSDSRLRTCSSARVSDHGEAAYPVDDYRVRLHCGDVRVELV